MQVNLAELLQLERPLAIFDFETTGLDPEKDRICQMFITVHYQHRDPIAWGTLVDPTVPITNGKESHGISDEDVRGKPTFAAIAPVLAPKILNCDFGGYNIDFDIRFLRAEMKRAQVPFNWSGDVIDAFPLYRKYHGHTLENCYREYGGEGGQPLPAGTKLEGAHDAGIDVGATEMALRGLLLRHPELPRNVKALAQVCFPLRKDAVDQTGKFVWVGEDVCITFGKYAKNGPFPIKRIERHYWEFILKNDFPADVKEIARNATVGVYPKKEPEAPPPF